MSPGNFDLVREIGEFDTFVSSGFFPILPGERQRMAISVAIAGGGINTQADIESAIEKQKQAELAYNADYQFAQAPLQVTLRAVPGDGHVTLYWDDISEISFDRYINRIGGDGEDFEGYRVYKSTDAAFLDAKVVTDAYGVKILNKPIAQFDKDDGIKGLHPIDINGVKFDLGNDFGLEHEYTDYDVINGQAYYYAVTAYDFGYEPGRIPPTESTIRVDVDVQGNTKLGSNVVIVRPAGTAAGYIPPEIEIFEHTSGGSSAEIEIDIVDPLLLNQGDEYSITFEDTIIVRDNDEVLTTKNYSLENITREFVLVDADTNISNNSVRLVYDGFKLNFTNVEKVEINEDRSKWNNPEVFDYDFQPVVFLTVKGIQKPNDYLIIFDEVGFSTSYDTLISFLPLPATDVNFKVYNITDKKFIEFAFSEVDGDDGRFTINDENSILADVKYFLE